MPDAAEVFVSLAAVSIVIIIVALLRRNSQKKDHKRRPPSLPSLPLIGSFPFFRGSIDEMPHFFMETAETLGPIFHFNAGSKLALVLNDKNSIVNALQRHAEAFGDRPDFWTEANVFNVNLKGIGFHHYNDDFKHLHKLVLSILREFGYGTTLDTEVRICEEIEVLLKYIHEQNSQPFYPKLSFAAVSGAIMLKILFGRKSMSVIKPSEIIKNSSEFITRLEPKINNAPIIRFLPKYRKMLEEMRVCHARLLELLENAIQHSQSDDSESNFVSRYLEIEGPDYDRENLLYIIRDLVIASSDSVSSTVQWTIIELANHIDIQTRLQKEIDEVIPKSRLPSINDKPYLPYTEAVIMENMRRHTPGPFSIPHMTCQDTEVCGYEIPSGCLVLPNLYAVHMDPKVWVDPDNFKPERFLDKDNIVTGKDTIMPFSLGKRSCIGEILARHTVFLLLTSLVQQFEFRPPTGQDSIAVKSVCTLINKPSFYELRMIPRKA